MNSSHSPDVLFSQVQYLNHLVLKSHTQLSLFYRLHLYKLPENSSKSN